MSTTDKATPKWAVRPVLPGNDEIVIVDEHWNRIAEGLDMEVAALIVRAVNNHEALVEALAKAAEHMIWMLGGWGTNNDEALPLARKGIDDALSALASARGDAE